MAEEAAAGATPLLCNLPDEIVLCEILVRLDPNSLLRCRAVRRAWRCATSTRRFLLAHHARQPALPIVRGNGHRSILAFDHRADADAQLHTVARLAEPFILQASCDGLLLLSKSDRMGCSHSYLSICNPAMRQHASSAPLPDFNIVGMYLHRATGEYRLLLQRKRYRAPEGQTGLYVLALGSDRPPRYVGCSETKFMSAFFTAPVRVRDSLHWYPVHYDTESDPSEYYGTRSKLVTVFHTIAESFRQMRAPIVATNTYIFEMDGMLGLYCYNRAMNIFEIWVLQNYEIEFWDLRYRVELPMAEIRGKPTGLHGDCNWYVTVISGDGDVLLLVSFGDWLFYVHTDGVLVASFHGLNACQHRLKQTLVPHDFFTRLEGYAVDTSPFI